MTRSIVNVIKSEVICWSKERESYRDVIETEIIKVVILGRWNLYKIRQNIPLLEGSFQEGDLELATNRNLENKAREDYNAAVEWIKENEEDGKII